MARGKKPAKPKADKPAKTRVRKPRKRKATPKKLQPKKKATPKPAPPKSAAPPPAMSRPPAPGVPPIATEPAQDSDAIPQMIAFDSSSGERRLSLTARERALRASPVVEILDDEHPTGALRRFLETLKAEATPQQAQIALGAAQLILLPLEREARGGREVKELVDLVLRHWDQFGERRRGFHAQEFIKHALFAVGLDRTRVQALEELVPPSAGGELLFNLAAAYALSRDKVAMLRSVQRALEAGISAAQFRRDPDFLVYATDADLALVLSQAEVPRIPVNVEPHLPIVRAALDHLVTTLKEFGEPIELRPPVRLDAILDAERARKISLPNDYRALLTITNGMTLWDHTFFGAGDYRDATPLSLNAQRYLEMQATQGAEGIEECIPLARWGQPTDWLLYDPRGRIRGGDPGYLLRMNTIEEPLDDLSAALGRIEHLARETLGTN